MNQDEWAAPIQDRPASSPLAGWPDYLAIGGSGGAEQSPAPLCHQPGALNSSIDGRAGPLGRPNRPKMPYRRPVGEVVAKRTSAYRGTLRGQLRQHFRPEAGELRSIALVALLGHATSNGPESRRSAAAAALAASGSPRPLPAGRDRKWLFDKDVWPQRHLAVQAGRS